MSAMARLVIDCTDDYHKRVVKAAEDRGVGYKRWIVRLIDDAIKKGPTLEEKVPSKYQPVLRTVAEMLASGDELVAGSLARSLEGFCSIAAAAVKKPHTGK